MVRTVDYYSQTSIGAGDGSGTRSGSRTIGGDGFGSSGFGSSMPLEAAEVEASG